MLRYNMHTEMLKLQEAIETKKLEQQQKLQEAQNKLKEELKSKLQEKLPPASSQQEELSEI